MFWYKIAELPQCCVNRTFREYMVGYEMVWSNYLLNYCRMTLDLLSILIVDFLFDSDWLDFMIWLDWDFIDQIWLADIFGIPCEPFIKRNDDVMLRNNKNVRYIVYTRERGIIFIHKPLISSVFLWQLIKNWAIL